MYVDINLVRKAKSYFDFNNAISRELEKFELPVIKLIDAAKYIPVTDDFVKNIIESGFIIPEIRNNIQAEINRMNANVCDSSVDSTTDSEPDINDAFIEAGRLANLDIMFGEINYPNYPEILGMPIMNDINDGTIEVSPSLLEETMDEYSKRLRALMEEEEGANSSDDMTEGEIEDSEDEMDEDPYSENENDEMSPGEDEYIRTYGKVLRNH